MANVANFVQSPSEELLHSCTREQLLKLVEHYEVDIGERQLKEDIKEALRVSLVDKGVLSATMIPSNMGGESVAPGPVALTFEQQKELLLLLQMERDKLEIEKQRLQHSLGKEQLEQSVRSDQGW